MSHLELIEPKRLWTRAEVLERPSPVPNEPGIYAWYFKTIPPGVPTDGCLTQGDLTLLYVGISPSRPPENGKAPSRQRLRDRIRNHLRGNAAGSTLRLTLGCLLSDDLGIRLQCVGSAGKMTFAEDEPRLSAWMQENALVTWLVHPEPWRLEEELISTLSLPLNLDQNIHHPFHPRLSEIRRMARKAARGASGLPSETD